MNLKQRTFIFTNIIKIIQEISENPVKAISFLMILPLIATLGYAQHEELKDKITWEEDRTLTWSDFKGPADMASKFYASTNSGVFYQVQQISQNDFLVFVETFFDPKYSWKKEDQVTHNLLKHEQLHFDIQELYSRYFIKSISETEFREVNKVFGKIRELYAKSLEDAQDFSMDYDKETNHSIDKVAQLLWEKKIDALLDETREYDLKEISIKIIHR